MARQLSFLAKEQMKHPPDCKRTFAIDIGKTPDGYIAVVKSLIEEKVMVIKATNMRLMMNQINKVVRSRASYLRRFPFTPSPIVTVEQHIAKASDLILPRNGN